MFSNQKVLVMGAAKSGIAVSKLLKHKNADVTLIDQKDFKEKEELEMLGIRVLIGQHDPKLLDEGFDFCVKNPGINYQNEFVKLMIEKNIKIVSEIEIEYRCLKNCKIGAITGTNGKTTATTLLHLMLEKQYGQAILGGNIGIPFSSYQDLENEYIALELSNFQLLGIDRFKANVSAIINLTPDHLDYMPTLESYYESKTLIYKNQGKNDYFLRNIDDENIMSYAKDIKCQVVDFSLNRTDVDVYLKDDGIYFKNQLLVKNSSIKIVGLHNKQNIMVASAMAYLLGVSAANIDEVVARFNGVEHRIEFVRELDGVRYYNDSKGTNVDSSIVALKAFDDPTIFICGGKDKGLDLTPLKPYLKNVKVLIAYGQMKERFKEIFDNCLILDNIEQAVAKAKELAKKGDVVLLSPTTSSFDQFKNYEERGRYFKECVNNLGGN